jgi:spermidine synthase
MRPWELIDSEAVPADDSTLCLVSDGRQYAIRVDDRELMGDGLHGSEDALAEYACDGIRTIEDARVLVGGLGMGFTLAAVLRWIGAAGHVTVAELLPAVVRWNRDYVGRTSGYPLRDPRVTVYIGDVADLLSGPPPWSAILLDVDNGPNALTRATNGWLYTKAGLRAAHDALIPGGILGIWSALGSASLTRRLRKAGFDVDVIRHIEEGRPTETGDGTHILWIARRPMAGG